MLLRVYSVFDQKAAAYLEPFFVGSDGVAVRAFSELVSDPNHRFGRHPADYTLFYLGEFDNEQGKMVSTTPRSCGNGLQLLSQDAEIPFCGIQT